MSLMLIGFPPNVYINERESDVMVNADVHTEYIEEKKKRDQTNGEETVITAGQNTCFFGHCVEPRRRGFYLLTRHIPGSCIHDGCNL